MRGVLPVLLAATLTLPPAIGAAQSDFEFGADNEGAPIDPPGFRAAGQRAEHDRPKVGSPGKGDYSFWLNRYSIVEPERDAMGLWSIYFVTGTICRSLYQAERSLIDVAPKGFVIQRGDVHSFGVGSKNFDNRWYAITVTGDSETDAAGGHPYWEIKYADDGSLLSCAVTVGSSMQREAVMAGDADRADAIQFMYIGVPQQFSAILLEPRFAGLYALAPGQLITMAVPCASKWCRITTMYDFAPGQWYATSRIRFDLRQN